MRKYKLIKLCERDAQRNDPRGLEVEDIFRRRRLELDLLSVNGEFYAEEWRAFAPDIERSRDRRDIFDDFSQEEKAELDYPPFRIAGVEYFPSIGTQKGYREEVDFFVPLEWLKKGLFPLNNGDWTIDKLEKWGEKPTFVLLEEIDSKWEHFRPF